MAQRIAQRDDTLSSLPAADGEGVDLPLRVDDQGALWTRANQFQYKDVNEVANDAATDSTAGTDLLTYDPPSGKTAVVLGVSKFDTTGNTAVLDVVVNDGTNDIHVEQYAADTNGFTALAVTLEDGHTLFIEVDTAGAANDTADLAIFAKEEV